MKAMTQHPRRGFRIPLSRSPRGKAGVGEGSPHAAKTMRLPPQEGFQNALLNPPW
jgi:hypothetical protein